jgi:hypothetical protein
MDYLSAITGALKDFGDYKTANNTAASQSQLAAATLAQQTAANQAQASNTRLMIIAGGAVLAVVAIIALRH